MPGHRAPTGACSPTWPRRPARTCATRSAPRAAPSRAWAGRTAYNRGQILYRIAEVLEGRAAQLAGELEAVGVAAADARADVESAVDAAVYWAGFADKLDQLVGAVNPVAGPVPQPLQRRSRSASARSPAPTTAGWRGVLGLVLPGDHGRERGGRAWPAGPAALVTSTLGEVVATSDVPGGVVNLLTGDGAVLLPVAGGPRGRGPDRPDAAPRRTGRPTWRRGRPTTSSASRAPAGPRTSRRPTRSARSARSGTPPGSDRVRIARGGRRGAGGRPPRGGAGVDDHRPRPARAPTTCASRGEIEDAVRAGGRGARHDRGARRRGARGARRRPRCEEIAAREDVVKLGVRDLGPALVRGVPGATTVASTAHVAARAGIARLRHRRARRRPPRRGGDLRRVGRPPRPRRRARSWWSAPA